MKGLTAMLIFAALALVAPSVASAAPQVCSKSAIEHELISEALITQAQLDDARVDAVICGDLTGDGGPDALFTVGSGGTAGDMAWGVLQGFKDNTVGTVMTYDDKRTGVAVSRVNSTTFEVGFPRYRSTDADCCPSAYRIWRYQYLPKQSPTFVHTKSKTVKRLPSRFKGG